MWLIANMKIKRGETVPTAKKTVSTFHINDVSQPDFDKPLSARLHIPYHPRNI